MTDTSTPMKFIIGFGAILAIGIPTFVVGQYVSDLRHDMEASKVEVERLKGQITSLQDILQKSQSSSSGAQGPKGDRGDKGEPGEVGPQGMRGERGPPGIAEALNEGAMQAAIDEALQKKLETIPKADTSPMAASLTQALDLFQTKTCIPISSLKGLKLLTLRVKQEFCDKDGRLRFRVSKFSSQDRIFFDNPGIGERYCDLERNCDLGNIGKFLYERKATDDDGEVALFRLIE